MRNNSIIKYQSIYKGSRQFDLILHFKAQSPAVFFYSVLNSHIFSPAERQLMQFIVVQSITTGRTGLSKNEANLFYYKLFTMFVAISSFEVTEGFEEQVKQAFRSRPKLVENHADFVRLEVLTTAKNPAEFWLITHWKNEAGFKSWHSNHLKDSHQGIPKGLKLVPHSFKLLFFEQICS